MSEETKAKAKAKAETRPEEVVIPQSEASSSVAQGVNTEVQTDWDWEGGTYRSQPQQPVTHRLSEENMAARRENAGIMIPTHPQDDPR